MCHHSLLVALQLMLPRVVREVGSVLPVHITVGQRDGCEVVVVGMTVPIHIQSEEVGVIQFPFATYSSRGIVVAEVVGLDVHTRVLAAGTVDALAVEGTICIEFYVLIECVGEVFCHLPVGVSVYGLVARVGDHKFRLMRVFPRGVLPSVAMLQLEIGVAAQLAEIQSDAVVLAQFAIGTASCGVLEQETFRVVLLRDDVHHTCDGITSVECRGSSFHNLNLLDVVRVDESEVILPAIVTMDAFAVDENEDVVVAQTVHLHLTAHVTFVEGEGSRQSR